MSILGRYLVMALWRPPPSREQTKATAELQEFYISIILQTAVSIISPLIPLDSWNRTMKVHYYFIFLITVRLTYPMT